MWLLLRGQKFHSSTRNYEWNLERTSNSSQSTCPVGRVLCKELLEEVILHIKTLMFFIAYAFKEQVPVFAGQLKIVSHLSCRTKAIFKYFCPLLLNSFNTAQFCMLYSNLLTFKKKKKFWKNFFQENYRSVKRFGARLGWMFFVGPVLRPICLQRLKADNTNRQRVKG